MFRSEFRQCCGAETQPPTFKKFRIQRKHVGTVPVGTTFIYKKTFFTIFWKENRLKLPCFDLTYFHEL